MERQRERERERERARERERERERETCKHARIPTGTGIALGRRSGRRDLRELFHLHA